MAGTARNNLGLIEGYTAGEDGWDASDRANLRRLDSVVMLSVKDKDTNAPPGGPTDGDRYIVGPSGSGAWSGHAGKIATWNSSSSAWDLYTPKKGWRALVEDEGREYVHSGSSWFAGEVAVSVTRFSSFQAAHDALPAGATLFVPAQSYTHGTTPSFGTTTTPGLTITKPITIIGEHAYRTGAGGAPFLRNNAGSGAENQDGIFVNTVGGVTIKNLWIQGAGAPGSGAGVRWYKASTNMSILELEGVTVDQSCGWSFRFHMDATFYLNKLLMRNCHQSAAQSQGALTIGNGNGGGTGVAAQADNIRIYDCEFSGPGFGTMDSGLQRGAIHFFRCTNTRIHNLSYQGPDDSPAISFAGTCWTAMFTDLYIERTLTGSTIRHAICVEDAVVGLTIKGLHYTGHGATPRVLKTSGNTCLRGARISDAFILTDQATITATDDFVLQDAADELDLNDNVRVASTVTAGHYAPPSVSGTGAGLKTIASTAALVLPVTSTRAYKISGTAAITSIQPHAPGKIIYLIFTGTAATTGLTNGSNLKIGANFVYTPDDCIALVCDGTNWYRPAIGAVN
ncbi:MAG TPA: DUF2793 domain-containing protein [Candidatus Eisenbacteria bacterium]|nr:DUF2793 domain-containing protein [Candidatus Eisenbacteria bacterium]